MGVICPPVTCFHCVLRVTYIIIACVISDLCHMKMTRLNFVGLLKESVIQITTMIHDVTSEKEGFLCITFNMMTAHFVEF